MNKMRENFQILGKYMDVAEAASLELLLDLYPDVTENFLADYERVYGTSNAGTDTQRKNRVISAMRQRGGLTKEYFEAIGNKMGAGDYTVSISQGTSAIGFIVAPLGEYDSPPGPATSIPGEIAPVTASGSPYYITVIVTGTAGPEPELEKLYERLKPAWTIWTFIYVP